MPNLFQDFFQLSDQELFERLDNIKPQAIAVIVYFLPTEQGKHLLKKIPSLKRKEILHKIDLLAPLSEEAMMALGEIITQKINEKRPRIPINGGQVLAGIIKNSKPELKKIIASIVSTNKLPIASTKPVTFEELANIPDRFFQKLIKSIERKTLLTALKTDALQFSKKLKDNSSQGAIELLDSDLRDLGPVKKSDVVKSQASIVSLAYDLETKGILVFNDTGEQIN
jgi:flagellar motor switch protein FliG